MNNTVVRSISGTIFLGIVTGSLWWDPVAFALVMLFAILVMTKEFLSISLGNAYKTSRSISLIGVFMLYLLFFLYYHNNIAIKFFWLLTFPYAGMIISILYEKENNISKNKVIEKNVLKSTLTENESSYLKTGFIMMAPLYIALPFSLTNTILFDSTGFYMPHTLLAMFIILWSCDVGAYVFGISFGQKNGHKLFPSISPKKSWEGFFGGAFAASVSGYIFSIFIPQLTLVEWIVFSEIIVVFGTYGDLIESLLKRTVNVKDSGTAIPGHGGLLDRFDSMLLAAPLIYIYLSFVY